MSLLCRKTKIASAVTEILRSANQPLTINIIQQQISKGDDQIAFSTIYRIVKKLEASGAIVRTGWIKRSARYEWINSHHYHHAICNSCGKDQTINDESLHYSDDAVAKKTGFTVLMHSIELFGICKKCRSSNH